MGNSCCCCVALDPDKSVLIDGFTHKEILQGPGWKFYKPWESVKILTKIPLNSDEYLVVKHLANRNYEASEHENTSLSRSMAEQTVDARSVTEIGVGSDIIEHISGPAIYKQRDPFAEVSKVFKKTNLAIDEYAIITNGRTGAKKTVQGPTLYMPEPYELIGNTIKKITLNNNQYVHVTNTSTGDIITVIGPKTFALDPFDKVSPVLDKITLTMDDYVKVVNRDTGVIRVERGPSVVTLGPYEQELKRDKAILVDENTAVHIKDIDTGVEVLITEKQKFVPPPNVIICGVKKMIKLTPYQCVVVIDKSGKFVFIHGDKQEGFFLPPFSEIYKQEWSKDRTRAHKEIVKVDMFDKRPCDMDFEFSVRSSDNVEIFMVVNVYWAITDVEKMIKNTNDPLQDICNHVRSQILSMTSRMSTQDIMEKPASELVSHVNEDDISFYTTRGVIVSRIDVVEKKCANKDIESTYKQIIDKKIERVRNLEQQRGDNEKKAAEIEGQIDFEKRTGDLLEQKFKNLTLTAKTTGESEGAKLRMFFDGLGDMTPEQKLHIFMELERTKRITTIADKVDNLYLTPKDIDFSVLSVKDDTHDNIDHGKVSMPVSVNLNPSVKR
jgi:hypothetical protein